MYKAVSGRDAQIRRHRRRARREEEQRCEATKLGRCRRGGEQLDKTFVANQVASTPSYLQCRCLGFFAICGKLYCVLLPFNQYTNKQQKFLPVQNYLRSIDSHYYSTALRGSRYLNSPISLECEFILKFEFLAKKYNTFQLIPIAIRFRR